MNNGLPVEINWTGEAVEYMAGMRIDADGANGQNGKKAAYRADGKGSELLANGGMKISKERVVFAKKWGRDIVETGADGLPRVVGGVVISKTSLNPYVDSETVPYVAVPPQVVRGVREIVLGCLAVVRYGGNKCRAVVADVGPRNKVGEGSIALARALGIPSSPRSGGVAANVVHYQIFPGVPAEIQGVKYRLQSSK